MKGGNPLEFLDDFCCAIRRPNTNKEVDVVWLDSQAEHMPPFFLAFLFDQLTTPLSNRACKNRLAATWTLNQMAHNEMDPMFISLVLFYGLFHGFNLPGSRPKCKG